MKFHFELSASVSVAILASAAIATERSGDLSHR